jgi:hypothetical protein
MKYRKDQSHQTNMLYCHPILGKKFLTQIIYASIFLTLILLIIFTINKQFAFTDSIAGSPIFCALSSILAFGLMAYMGLSQNHKEIPVEFKNRLLEYQEDQRFHRSILNCIFKNGTLYVGDMLKITKMIEMERNRLSELGIDLYLTHGDITLEIIEIDKQLEIIHKTQKYLASM